MLAGQTRPDLRNFQMKQVLLATALTIACAAAFAQKGLPTQDGSPATAAQAAGQQKSVDQRNANNPNPTTQQAMPIGQDGAPIVPSAAAAQRQVDNRNANNPNPTTQQAKPIGQDGPQAAALQADFQTRVDARNSKMYVAMDLNGDGRVSRSEWNAYHGKNWSGLKQSNGAVSREEMEMMMKRSY
jgi:hypothetical protein